jgi:K+-transporting ATPase KdpF subunit
MSVIDAIGLLLAVVLAIYLIVALLKPEKFQ